MQPKSAIKKGKKAEDEVARRIILAGLGRARREIGSGNGKRKSDIDCNLSFLIEVKNEKQTNFLPNIDQAKRQAEQGNFDSNKWCLITVDPRGVQEPERMTMYATIELGELLELLKRNQEPKVKQPDKELKWQLELLSEYLKHLEKEQETKYYYSKVKKICNEIIKRI